MGGDIEIKVDVPDGVCAIRVDPGEFELAILNLAVNAKDAMPAGGTLSIRAKAVTLKGEASEEGLSGEFVAIRVADTGHGIPPDVLARVFEPFFTTKEVGKGTGLGLSQVYGFAKQSGGTATISSAEGRGTAITIYLPRSHEAPQTPSPQSQTPRRRPSRAGTVLLVEDNADVAEVGAGIFPPARLSGAQRRQCAGGAGGPAAGWRRRPGIFRHPDAGRHERPRSRARDRRRAFPTIPVLLTTGYSASAQDAVRHGVVVLQKPYDLESLRRNIREAIEGAKARRRQAEPAK